MTAAPWTGEAHDLVHLASDEDPSRRACDGGPMYPPAAREVRLCEACRRLLR